MLSPPTPGQTPYDLVGVVCCSQAEHLLVKTPKRTTHIRPTDVGGKIADVLCASFHHRSVSRFHSPHRPLSSSCLLRLDTNSLVETVPILRSWYSRCPQQQASSGLRNHCPTVLRCRSHQQERPSGLSPPVSILRLVKSPTSRSSF